MNGYLKYTSYYAWMDICRKKSLVKSIGGIHMVQQNSLMEVVFLFLLCPKKIWGLSGKKRFFHGPIIHTYFCLCVYICITIQAH